ncbi:SDR family NAD(P)-dependent oxidoreductase [Microbacterium sp. LMI12-1-1.1]|uniref:SDR family NAD(P)-dependent oxidoreductase n=1 Tax=Microbacterium sp. LMI12-1-1.1 TaxID=3135225 RepID=UPI0034480D6E
MSRTRASHVTLPDLRGRTALVTGASDGVGVEIARGLAGAGADLLLPVRNRDKGARVIDMIRTDSPDARVGLRDLDLARLASVDALAAAMRAERAPLDIVVLNAGIVLLGDPERHVSADGFELHFQTNFLGHFALTTALLPLLQERGARVVVQLSLAAAIARPAWNDLQGERRYSPLRAYGASKAALGLFAYELARRSAAEGWGISVQLSHPGVVPDTGIAPAMRARQRSGAARGLAQRLGSTPAQAAQPALLAAVTDADPLDPAGEDPLAADSSIRGSGRQGRAASPGFFGPSGWMHFGGPADALRPYRRLAHPAAGARMWAIAEKLLRDRADAVRA